MRTSFDRLATVYHDTAPPYLTVWLNALSWVLGITAIWSYCR